MTTRRVTALTATIAALAVLASAGAMAKPKQAATFLGSATYAMDGGCEKRRALAAGGPRNIGTVPETLTASGFDGWEGGCSFERITEVQKGKLYKAVLACGESADEWTETNTFALSDGGATVTVRVLGKEKKTSVFKRCDAPAAKPAAK